MFLRYGKFIDHLIGAFIRNVEEWPNILLAQDFKSMFGHFSALYMKGLSHFSQHIFLNLAK